MYLTNDLMNWADWLNDICILRVMDIHWSYQNLLFWAGIVWHRISANQIGKSDVSNLKKLKNYLRYQTDLLLPLKLQKMYYFGLYPKCSWPIDLQNFTFDLSELLILIPGVHYYVVFVGSPTCELVLKLTMTTPWRVIQLESSIN